MADYFDILQVHEITNGIGIFKQRSAAKKTPRFFVWLNNRHRRVTRDLATSGHIIAGRHSRHHSHS